MPIICPAILAASEEEYKQQIEKIAHFSHRIQIDLTDGRFAKHPTISPKLAWWPVGVKADIHLMYADPVPTINILLEHKPHLIIVHAEAQANFGGIAELCHKNGIKVGMALLQQTSVSKISAELGDIDHVLIFSGNLGEYGGQADINLLSKASEIKQKKPDLETGWDGGINYQNAAQIVFGGVDVLNVGGFIQKSEAPEKTFTALQRIADETGTT